MSIRFCIFIYSRRFNRCCFSQLFNWYYSSRYILCCSSFSLCFIYRSCFRYFCWNRSLISIIYRTYYKSKMTQNSFSCNICRSKFNFLSSTFFRIKWYTSAILWLPRCIYCMKCFILNRFYNFINCCIRIYYNCMRSFKNSSTCNIFIIFTNINWMAT